MNELLNVCNIFTYSLSCLFKILFDVQYWEDNHETYPCYFSHCNWRKFSWGNGILLFCSVNTNLRSMILFEPFCLSMIFFFLINLWISFEKAFNTCIEIFKLPLTAIRNLTALHGAQSAFSDSALSVIDW